MNKNKNQKGNFTQTCEWVFSKPIYHRGKFNNINIFENTIEAYYEAMIVNCAIELDVQLTSDYEVICFHDDNLKRLFNRERLVKDISYKRINKLREDLRVPLLKDVLNLIDSKVELMIELKSIDRKSNKVLVEKVHECLKEYKGDYVIVSFNPSILRKYRRIDKEVCLGRIGTGNVKGFFNKLIVEKHYFNFLFKPDFISYDIDNYNEIRLKKFKDKGYKILGWSLKNKNKEKDLRRIYDNFIIEDE